MSRSALAAVLAVAVVSLGVLPAAAAPQPAKSAPEGLPRSGAVHVARVSGSINPASADYIRKSITRSEQAGAALLLIELDTPGGLVASTKDIIQAMLAARVPVAVYVAPQGAWAGSAGTFIAMAAHIAAMAPGSSIGAAHPIGIGGSGGSEGEEKQRDVAGEKAENLLAAYIESIAKERGRNVEWAVKAVRESVAVTAEEALRLRVIDLVAPDRAGLLREIDGREVEVGGQRFRLAIAQSAQHEVEMSILIRFLHFLFDPNVVTLLLMGGALLLYIEFNQPGLVAPGVAGAICLVLALMGVQVLPFSWLGLLLLVGGLGLLAGEAVVGSYGVLFAAGIACILLGGSLVFDRPEMSDLDVDFWSVLVPAAAALGICGALVALAVGRTHGRPQTAGVGELLGMVGRTATALGPEGTVFVRGEYWRARATEPVAADERVEVLGVSGLELTVRRAPPDT